MVCLCVCMKKSQQFACICNQLLFHLRKHIEQNDEQWLHCAMANESMMGPSVVNMCTVSAHKQLLEPIHLWAHCLKPPIWAYVLLCEHRDAHLGLDVGSLL